MPLFHWEGYCKIILKVYFCFCQKQKKTFKMIVQKLSLEKMLLLIEVSIHPVSVIGFCFFLSELLFYLVCRGLASAAVGAV